MVKERSFELAGDATGDLRDLKRLGESSPIEIAITPRFRIWVLPCSRRNEHVTISAAGIRRRSIIEIMLNNIKALA